MKKCIQVICCLIAACLLLSSCAKSKGLNIGFNGESGLLPQVHFGIKSDHTEFDISDVTLDFSYGKSTGINLGNYVGGENGEDCPIVCVAVYFFNAKHQDVVTIFGDTFFEDYRNIEGLHFVKEISLEDYNENYNVDSNFWRCRYEHTESLTIPKDVLELSTGYACIGVFEIAYVPSKNLYRIVGGGYQALKYEKLDSNTVNLSKPTGSFYADPVD